MKLTTEFLFDTAVFIKEYFNSGFSNDFAFHNYNRTVNIVRYCDALGVQLNVSANDQKILHIAALFLETGYCKDVNQPQKQSVSIATDYLRANDIDDEIIKNVEEIILSNRIPRQPLTLMAQIICDAGTYHLAEKDFLQQMDNLRSELKAIEQKEYTDIEWLSTIMSSINEHFYYTGAAKELFEKKKQKQLLSLQKLHDNLQIHYNDQTGEEETVIHTKTGANEALADIKLERGVETFFRITERRHMELSTKAHDKASLLISINSIVISIVLSVLITKLEDNTYLLLPTLFLVITCAVTIVLAIISTRPRFIKSTDHTKHTNYEEVNILFFGDFSKLSLTDYKKAMKKTYENKTELYDSLSRDIYYQGMILVWKYKYINIAYNIFMYGFIITILSFMIAFILHTS